MLPGVQGDVSKLADLIGFTKPSRAEGRRIDVVFANAGLGEFAALGSITEEHFDKLFNTNVKGALFTVQKALPLLNDGGSIILTGSVGSVKGTPAFWVYGATKAAIRNFVRAWTIELKDRRIRSNVLSPGPTETTAGGTGSLPRPLRGWYPLSRWDAWASPEEDRQGRVVPCLRRFQFRHGHRTIRRWRQGTNLIAAWTSTCSRRTRASPPNSA